MNANLTLATGLLTAVPFQANIFDSSGVHSGTVDNTRFTVPVGFAGTWAISASVSFGTGAITSQSQLRIRKNGSSIIAGVVTPLNATFGVQCQISGLDVAVDGDYYDILAYQNTGSNMTVLGLSGFASDTHAFAYKVG